MRIKRPDRKNAISLLESARRDMEFTLTIDISENSGTTVIRNIYECFRMLGDSLLVAKGIESIDHIAPIKELMNLKIKADRPIQVLDNLRRMRHNINYYGYKPSIGDVEYAVSIADALFIPLSKEVENIIK